MPANIPPCSATPTAPLTSPAGTRPLSHAPALTPVAGSAAAALFAAGFGCGSAPGGLNWSGGPHPELRSYTDAATGLPASREGGLALAPEKSLNYSIGFELAPTTFLKGLDVQATWYSVKVNGTLLGFNTTTSNTLADPLERFHVILPSDLGCPVAANANPQSCAPFEKMALAALSDRNSTQDPSIITNVYWISDGSTVGTGFLKVDGIDWSASYDWDWGDLGAWNTGITGTYYLHRYNATVNGGTIVDLFHQNIQGAGGIAQNGVETLPRMNYRARLGWSNGPWSVTGFMNYISHYYPRMARSAQCQLPMHGRGRHFGGRHVPLRHQQLEQYRAVLVHLRSVLRLRHRRYAGQQLPQEHHRSGHHPEPHGHPLSVRVRSQHQHP